MSHTIYLPVVPRLGLTSEERGKAISAELFNLTLPRHLQPPGQTSMYALGLIENASNAGQWALVGDHDHVIAVHPERDVTALVSLFPQLSEEERSQLTYYIATSDSVTFGNLLPSDSTQLTREQAEALGWFPDDPFDE
jgi:hypothetical protein